MPKGYLILTEDIHDPEKMAEYAKSSGSALAEYGGRPLVVDEAVEVLEGTWHGTRTVVVEFESVEKAHEWYRSEGYQKALPLRQAAADCNAVIVSGWAPKGG